MPKFVKETKDKNGKTHRQELVTENPAAKVELLSSGYREVKETPAAEINSSTENDSAEKAAADKAAQEKKPDEQTSARRQPKK